MPANPYDTISSLDALRKEQIAKSDAAPKSDFSHIPDEYARQKKQDATESGMAIKKETQIANIQSAAMKTRDQLKALNDQIQAHAAAGEQKELEDKSKKAASLRHRLEYFQEMGDEIASQKKPSWDALMDGTSAIVLRGESK